MTAASTARRQQAHDAPRPNAPGVGMEQSVLGANIPMTDSAFSLPSFSVPMAAATPTRQEQSRRASHPDAPAAGIEQSVPDRVDTETGTGHAVSVNCGGVK